MNKEAPNKNLKQILILSYHFPPMNAIAAQRSWGYAKHMKKYGFYPTIVTVNENANFYEGKLKHFASSCKKEVYDDYSVIRLNPLQSRYGSFLEKNEKGILLKPILFLNWVTGNLDETSRVYKFYISEKTFLKQHLKDTSYDVILGVFSPHYHLRNAYSFGNKFNIPFCLDFRDLWNNRIIHNQYKPRFSERTQDFYFGNKWKKWSKNSLLNSIISQPYLNKLKDITGAKGIVVNNGYESSTFKDWRTNEIKKEFKIIHNGSIYYNQNHIPFLKAVKKFITDYKPTDFKIEFIGATKPRKNHPKSLNGYISHPERIFSKYIEEKYLLVTEKKPMDEAFKIMKTASLLYFPSFPNSRGTYSGKIFEYIGSKINILSIPKDNSVVDKILEETNAGVSLDDENDILKYIVSAYQQWKEIGFVKYKGEQTELEKFTREYQTKILAENILVKLNNI